MAFARLPQATVRERAGLDSRVLRILSESHLSSIPRAPGPVTQAAWSAKHGRNDPQASKPSGSRGIREGFVQWVEHLSTGAASWGRTRRHLTATLLAAFPAPDASEDHWRRPRHAMDGRASGPGCTGSESRRTVAFPRRGKTDSWKAADVPVSCQAAARTTRHASGS